MQSDYVVIGGGVVGLSIAWGLLKRGRHVTIIDGDDGSFRASRGNFGLVWVQSKGLNHPIYAKWNQSSAKEWGDFAAELKDSTGFDVALEQNGGYDLHFSEETLQTQVQKYQILKDKLGGDYPFEVLDHTQLLNEEPSIGASVVGAILHHQDGHVNPLKLLKALVDDVKRMGGQCLVGKSVVDVEHNKFFVVKCADGTQVQSLKVLLCAGLGAMSLGPKLGFLAPIRPQRGQILVTEKLPKFINRPSLIARQVEDGGVQIGVSNEEVGFDDNVTVDGISAIASLAVKAHPALSKAQLVRTWGALRVMSKDGLPIYQQSKTMPGAYLLTCHSGVTLAAAHSRFLPAWLENDPLAPNLEVFSEDRFELL
jgi:glycine/D-amino acid oxidase-like deaminating enzyme